MGNKDDGMLSKQNVRPGKGIDKDADQLLHDPKRTGNEPLTDTQENLSENKKKPQRS
jgi:hypothetical protein